MRDKQLSISNEYICIRETTEHDMDFVVAAERDSDNAPFIVHWSRDQHLHGIGDSDVAHLIIENGGRRVGYSILRGMELDAGPIELKRLVITRKGCGYGRNSIAILKQLVFEKLHRRRFWLNVLRNNYRARGLYQSAGFRHEGTLRDAFMSGNNCLDLDLMACLSKDDCENKQLQIADYDLEIIHALSPKHILQLQTIYDQQWPDDTRTATDMEQAVLGAELIIGVVDRESGDLVGFCRVVSDRGFRAWIYGLLVRDDFRGLGIGRLIMEQAISHEAFVDVHAMELTCSPNMHEFYSKFGFKLRDSETVMKLTRR